METIVQQLGLQYLQMIPPRHSGIMSNLFFAALPVALSPTRMHGS